MPFIRKNFAHYLLPLILILAGCTTMDKKMPLRVEKGDSSLNKTLYETRQALVSNEQLKPADEEGSIDQFDADMIASTHTEQEIIDSALEYCQASNDFWEKGDLDNAIDCLDKAYSLTLRIDNNASPAILQEKEDLRITIAKRMLEVYSSRFTTVNGSHKAIPLAMNHHVQKAIDLFTRGKEKEWFLKVYARSGKYRPAIVRELKKAGLPEELSWLPFIESGYSNVAISSARALGMWQFIASTGYKYGLNRDNWIDERMNPEKATKAAIAYLTELHQIFGEWTTALAAYNCGEARVLREISTQKINYMDNFWDLYEKLPNETAFYVPKFLAVLHIVNNPCAYGIDRKSVV
jgi:membrane-bound lytic murein transglycosylase D